MATPTKSTRPAAPAPVQTPPKPAESAASVASRVAPLDLKALAAQPQGKTQRVKRTSAGGPGRAARDNSVVEQWVNELEAERKGAQFSPDARSLNITAAGLSELRSRLNDAAAKAKAGLGLAVNPITVNGRSQNLKPAEVVKGFNDKKIPGDTPVTVIYWTKRRKQVKSTTPTTTPPASA